MGGDDPEQDGRRGENTETQGRSVSRSRGVSVSAGDKTVTVSHSESRTGGCHHDEDDRTVNVAWAPMAAEDGSEIRGIVLTELARLLAEVPAAVSLDAVATRGNDLLLTLRVPRARLAKVFGERGTPDDP